MTDVNLTSQSGIVDFATAAAEVTLSAPADDRLLAGSPQHRTSNVFSDEGGKFFSGIWESTPGKWRIRYSENEFCHMTAGRVRITQVNGTVREFSAGDTFVIPAGFEGTWEVLEAARKLYVIYEP
ncbi:cupin domain-containing protein [Povalibacter sp.]|uniref:cupin domain-containing protein n=1 Tax=Povalibacter sp. TaxID=1962978 RepID=UPI002F4261E6